MLLGPDILRTKVSIVEEGKQAVLYLSNSVYVPLIYMVTNGTML